MGAYVVGDHYTAPWEFPPSKKFIDQGYNYMQTLIAVLTEQGRPCLHCSYSVCMSRPNAKLVRLLG